MYLNKELVTVLNIPDSVTSIKNYAFSCCSSLTSIVISDSVTLIGGYAFAGCSSLTSIVIPDSITSISEGAFRGCVGITEIETEIFDPSVHNAVMHEENDELGEGVITQVFLKGYVKDGHVIRFAMVKVAN